MELQPTATSPLPWSGRAPLLLGHRGAPRAVRENTEPAFRVALDAGLDGLETDLQRTRDGALVIHHDPYFKAPGAAHGPFIATLDLEQARERDPLLLTLQQLRDVMSDYPRAVVNLELKTSAPFDDARAEQLADELKRWPAEARERLWVSTFDPLQLLRLAEAEAPVHLAFLALEASALKLLPSLPVVAVHPHHTLVTAERVAEWHGSGLAVFTWTVNEADLARRLLEDGVDGLIGDLPEVLLGARR